jgi:hypothetical protein
MPQELTNAPVSVLQDASHCIMPSAPGKVTISVRVDQAVHAKFAEAAKADGRTIGNWLERAGIAALRAAGFTLPTPPTPATPPPTPRKRRTRTRTGEK